MRHTGKMLPPARYLMRAKDFVDARYADPITVADLAAAAGLSRAHFSRMFTRTFGESPSAYLQSRRLEHAGRRGLCPGAQLRAAPAHPQDSTPGEDAGT